ncbi:MAG: ChbG/HpnK family deacetylase, partial [Acidobacteriaceae bacterium]
MFERQKRRLVGLFGSAAQTAPNPNRRTVAEWLGYPADARLLVIHSDDFGMNRSVNRAIAQALEQGWINSASIMVPCPGFAEAALWAKAHPESDLGIHLTLNAEWTAYRWGPVSDQPAGSKLRDAEGYLPKDKKYVRQADPRDVEAEVRAQVERALAAGVKPSHLD